MHSKEWMVLNFGKDDKQRALFWEATGNSAPHLFENVKSSIETVNKHLLEKVTEKQREVFRRCVDWVKNREPDFDSEVFILRLFCVYSACTCTFQKPETYTIANITKSIILPQNPRQLFRTWTSAPQGAFRCSECGNTGGDKKNRHSGKCNIYSPHYDFDHNSMTAVCRTCTFPTDSDMLNLAMHYKSCAGKENSYKYHVVARLFNLSDKRNISCTLPKCPYKPVTVFPNISPIKANIKIDHLYNHICVAHPLAEHAIRVECSE